jgi:hypothetical protein
MSGLGIKDYINHLIPSFNEVGYILLNLYYQMSREGGKYAPRGNMQAVTGGDPFQTLDRTEMVARTNLQARAYAFDADKINEKMTDLALYQVLRPELLIAKNPQAVWLLLKTLTENWSPKWKNLSDRLIPTMDELQKMQIVTAVNGVKIFVQNTIANAQLTGQPPQYDPNALMGVVNDLEGQLVTSPPEEGK